MQRPVSRRSLLPLVDRSWHPEGACYGGEDMGLFFAPEREQSGDRVKREKAAKEICARCPVAGRCLEDALARDDRYGIRGGLTEDERRRMRRRLRQAGRLPDPVRDVGFRCECCGRLGRREGTGPNGEQLISACLSRWKRAGRPAQVPAPDPVKSAAARARYTA